MRDLGPDRLTDNGRYLLLRDVETSEPFRVPIDRHLRHLIEAASGTPRGASGQMEFTMESTLSPRDIQARIRRGESVTEVAESAGVGTDQIEGFAAPVLAEREFMVQQARRTVVRRKHVGGTGVALGALVDEELLRQSENPEQTGWNAWRREDGRWSITVTPLSITPAHFIFDHKSRYVVPENESAHELVADIAIPEASEMAIADALQDAEPEPDHSASSQPSADPALVEPVADPHAGASVASIKAARDRRAQEQLSLQDIEDPTAEESVSGTRSRTVSTPPEPAQGSAAEEPPCQSPRDTGLRETGLRETGQRAADQLETAQPETPQLEESGREDVVAAPLAVPDTGASVRKKRPERRRVPSWDEIMFGGRDGRE